MDHSGEALGKGASASIVVVPDDTVSRVISHSVRVGIKLFSSAALLSHSSSRLFPKSQETSPAPLQRRLCVIR